MRKVLHTAALAMTGMGLMVSGSARAAELGPDDIRVEGWRVTLAPFAQTVELDSIPLVNGEAETELKEGLPGWRGPFLLPGPAWAYRALRATSLNAALAADPATRLTPGVDFALDPDWAAVAALHGSAYGPGTRVKFKYSYGLSRIDRIELAPDGRIHVVKGVADKSQPRIPPATPGRKSLATVVIPNYADALTADMVNILDPAWDGVPPVARREHLDEFRRKLASDAPVTIVCFGDSITVQPERDFKDGRGNYVDRLAAWLRAEYPAREVVVIGREEPAEARPRRTLVVKAGVGGDTTAGGLRRLEKDVLARRPDLVTVMFGVNDENRRGDGNAVPPAEFRANLDRIVQSAMDAGSAVIVLTPGMKNPGWSATVGNMVEYAEAARAVAAERRVCLVDNYRAWERVGKRGYSPMVFLGNCINHPVDLAHEQKFWGLRSAIAEPSN